MANPKRKKRGRKVLFTVLIVLAILIAAGAVAVKLLRDRVSEAYGQKNTDEILSATVTVDSISTTISGSGTLSQQESTEVTMPSGVAVQSVLVEKNDTVETGQKIATVQMSSVLTAMNNVQDELDTLDKEIADASKDAVDTYVKSSVKGRVKSIYCAADDSVLSVMYEHNALLVLSLDGYLAFEIPQGTLAAGDALTVTLSDETVYTGTVGSIEDGTATILITDNKPLVGDTATASDAEGNVLGSGTLFIHQPLAVTGYAGTVSRVNVTENQFVYAKATLLTLKDTAFTANYETLLVQRSALEDQFNDLLKLYQAGAIYAPVAGKVSSVTESESEDNESDTWTVAVLVPQEKMLVNASVDESNILAVSIGQEASVTISSISDDPFTGEVTSIEKTGTSSNGVTSYTVTVTIDRTEKMLPNMSATIAVKVSGVDNALLIPEKAVTKTRDSAYVYTSVDETTGELSGMVEVKTGLSGGGYIEITEGLSEGDTVYYKDTQTNDFANFMNGFGGFGGGNSGGNGGMPSFGGDSGGPGGNSGGGMPSFGGGSGRKRGNGGD